MFNRFNKLIQWKPPEKPTTKLPEIPWIPAEKNPWQVPVLDVRPVTQHLISTSKDPACATNAMSYGQDDGTGFADNTLTTSRVVSTNVSFRIDQLLAPGVLFIPQKMEHKWAIFYHGGRMLFVRSWLRKVEAVAEVECSTDGLARVTSLRGCFVSENEDAEFTIRALDYLIRSHALGVVFPAPLPVDFEKAPQMSAMWCMNIFGSLAEFATPQKIESDMPDKLLRTHSLMHIAVARGDTEAVGKHLNAGLPIDLLAADGLTPLHWAFASKNSKMPAFLIERGCPVDVRSAEGATALMTVVQKGDLEKIAFLLNAGADVNAIDTRGFNSLHRVAEGGNIDVLQLLLDHGANRDAIARGHTALSLAEKLGRAEVVKRLKRRSI